MKKNPQRRSTNGVAFISGGSSVFSNTKSKQMGNVQFFTGKAKIKSKVKPVRIFIIEFEEYTVTLHPTKNPRMVHEAIGVSIGMNSPPVGSNMYNLPNSPAFMFYQTNNLIEKISNYSVFSVIREGF